MTILKNISLKPYNTFGIDQAADYFVEISSLTELNSVMDNPQFKNMPKLILGGGSNLLLTKDFSGIVIRINIQGIEIIAENEDTVSISVGAGVNWHRFVMYAIEHGYGGIENLSLIPGTVGASPMQNIGAYGVEIKEVFEKLEAFEISTGLMRTFRHEECQFGYRESIFKKEAKNLYIITSVTYKLSKKPIFHTQYGAIQDTLKEMNINELSIKSISDAVVHIRQSKLPDPAQIGNAGSFFKNPEIEEQSYLKLKTIYPEIPGYPTAQGQIKVPAGWLIEQAGWKGKTIGDAGVHKKQALVLVNYGQARGEEIWKLAMDIQASVKDKFNILIQPEVNII